MSALVDKAAWTPALHDLPDGPPELRDGWPNCYSICFEILYDLYWRLRPDEGFGATWAPAPRDLSGVECWYETPTNDRIWYAQYNLGGWRISALEKNGSSLNLGPLSRPDFWERCLSQGRAYLSVGDNNEALLMANIGIESLLDSRIAQFVSIADDPAAAADAIASGRLLFEEAERVLGEQFPEMAGKVRWPDRSVQPSRYAQIKKACRMFNVACSLEDARRQYSVVSRDRNDLVHGRQSDRVLAERAREALDAFEWYGLNFVLT